MLLTLDYHLILFIRGNILGVSGLEEVQLVHCIEYLTVGGWKLTGSLTFLCQLSVTRLQMLQSFFGSPLTLQVV